MWENSWRWQTRTCEYCEKKLRFRFIDEVILNEKTCNVTCTEHKRGLKFVAHKIIFLTISPFLWNMWQRSVSDFSHDISHEWQSWVKKRKLWCAELAQNMRRAEIRCSQSNTSFYQSVFAEHVTKIRVGFFRSKHTGSDSIIDDYVLQMWETFQLSRGTHEVEHKHVDEIIEEDKNIRGGDRHCKNCKKKKSF